MSIRKPQPDEVWRAFAHSSGGEVVEGRGGKVKEVRFVQREWTVVLDRYTVSTGKSSATFTRVRALADIRMPLKFSIYRENAIRRFGKLLGMQDIHAGNPEVDRNFIVRGDNESMIRSLLIDPAVYRPLLEQKSPRFEFGRFRGRLKNRQADLAELKLLVPVVVRDAHQLAAMVTLIRSTLDQLARIGAISAAAPAHSL